MTETRIPKNALKVSLQEHGWFFGLDFDRILIPLIANAMQECIESSANSVLYVELGVDGESDKLRVVLPFLGDGICEGPEFETTLTEVFHNTIDDWRGEIEDDERERPEKVERAKMLRKKLSAIMIDLDGFINSK